MTRDEMIAALEAVARTSDAEMRAKQSAIPNARRTILSMVVELRAGGPDGMATRETDPKLASLASSILNDNYKPTREEIMSMAGSLLSQAQGN